MHRGRVNFKKNEDRLRLSGVYRGRGDELLFGAEICALRIDDRSASTQ
jgi:hypothetical protein